MIDKEKITYMDCWNFIAPLIPVDGTDYVNRIYVMVYEALKRAQEEKEGRCEF